MRRKYWKLVIPFLAIVIIFGYTMVSGEEWEVIAVTEKAKYLCNTQGCLYVSDDIVRVWTRTEYEKPPAKGSSAWDVDYSLDFWEIDCQRKNKAVLEVRVYDRDGKIKKKYNYHSNPDRSGIAPGTIGEALYRSVCGTRESSY